MMHTITHKFAISDVLFEMKVVIVGGCGHVGLPLGVSLANLDCKAIAYEICSSSADLVNSGFTPFHEVALEN